MRCGYTGEMRSEGDTCPRCGGIIMEAPSVDSTIGDLLGHLERLPEHHRWDLHVIRDEAGEPVALLVHRDEEGREVACAQVRPDGFVVGRAGGDL